MREARPAGVPRRAPSAALAITAALATIGGRRIDAALVPGPGGQRLLVATAAGRSAAQVTAGTFRAVARAAGQHMAVQDIRPLPPGDPGAALPALRDLASDQGSWARVIRHARCADGSLDPDQWFPVSAGAGQARQEAAAAIAVCTTCLVRAQCLALSLRQWDTGQHGVWGGLVAAGRAALRRGRTRT